MTWDMLNTITHAANIWFGISVNACQSLNQFVCYVLYNILLHDYNITFHDDLISFKINVLNTDLTVITCLNISYKYKIYFYVP